MNNDLQLPDRRDLVAEIDLEHQLYTIGRLDKWLTYEGYSPLLLGGGFFLPVGLVLTVALIAAVVFIPLAGKWLYELRRYGWLTAEILVLLLALAAYLIPEEPSLLVVSLVFLPAFYIWTWALKLAVGQWEEMARHRLEFMRTK